MWDDSRSAPNGLLCQALFARLTRNVARRQEPTNHLDAGSVAWLERTLAAFKGTVVAVTHDRCGACHASAR